MDGVEGAGGPASSTLLAGAVGEEVGATGCRDGPRHGEERLERRARRGEPVVVAQEEAPGVWRGRVVERPAGAHPGLPARGPAGGVGAVAGGGVAVSEEGVRQPRTRGGRV